ncbi:centrosomal protein of 135 kDa-like isoform X2 [Branchiostoma floridae]|uniref:Centrosomal protein of 135 kDa-like isoform X2 n=1 Tax=Branchiostoma floridae TaxID=7739 RepID=A0A9J7MV00_BRAFL|nr:centrosomal protein of 135 kDa-like isoform X2 [Branchiostoma floridae]
MTSTAERKFANLRRRLDQLGYRQPLGIESLPLVEKLFADLVHTTESLKNLKLQGGKASQQPTDTDDDTTEPYRTENARLVTENNKIHLELISIKEAADKQSKDLKATIRKLEHENADLRFLNSQYIHKVRAVERDKKSMKDKIQQLQEKNLQAVVQTPGGKKRNIPFHRQRMEIDSLVPPADRPSPPPSPVVEDPYIADLLEVADNRIDTLTKDSQRLHEDKEALDRRIKTLTRQVEARDKEIERLGYLLEGGRPQDVVSMEGKLRANEKLISHLNVQVDYLQQANRDLERRLQDVLEDRRSAAREQMELSTRNDKLMSELQDIDRLAGELQKHKEQAITTADNEVRNIEIELRRSQRQLETAETEVTTLREERKSLLSENDRISSDLANKMAEAQRLHDLMDKVQEDKRHLSDRVNRLTKKEKDLVLELERLRDMSVRHKRDKSPSRLDNFIKSLEEERDYYKQEVDVLQNMIKKRSGSPAKTPTSTPTKGSSIKGTPTKGTPTKGSGVDKKTAAHYETILRVLEDERDFYKREYEMLRALRRSPTKGSPPTRDRSVDDMTEISRLRQERDELQSMLDKFERHMAEIQSNVKVLTGERDKTSMLYQQAQEEINRLRRDAVRSPKSPKATLAAQSILRRVENERDDAMADLRRMATERDSLRERLKISTETALTDRARLEQRIEDQDGQLYTVDQERADLQGRVASMRDMIDTLEDQVKSLTMKVASTEEEASQQKATATQMRLLAEQTEASLEDCQRRLTRKVGELQQAEERGHSQAERIDDMNRVTANLKDEIAQLRGAVSSLDREKDGLQMNVDEKTERVVGLEENVANKEKLISELRLNVGELETRLDRANDLVSNKEREIRSLRRQLDGTTEELGEVSRGREVALRENRRLQEDLGTMTKENQAVHQDLDETMSDRGRLKQQVQDYIAEVSRCEDLLAAKDREIADLLENYRKASTQAERWEMEAHQHQGESSNTKLELMSRESEVRRLREKADSQEREIQEHLAAQQAYELQVSNLTVSMQTLEEDLRQAEEEKGALGTDLSSVRELCVKLDTTKEALSRQLTQKSVDSEQAKTALEELRREADLLRSQVSSERASVRNLEGLLSTNREREFASQLTEQEQRSEIQLLKDRLTLAESKTQSQQREITTLRTRAAQLESDLERTKRNLTAERFEKERAYQELRRRGFSPSRISPPTDTSGHYSRSPYRRSTSPRRSSPPRSILKSPDRSRTRSPDRSITRSPLTLSFGDPDDRSGAISPLATDRDEDHLAPRRRVDFLH